MMKTSRIIGKITLCLFFALFILPDTSQGSPDKGSISIKVVRNSTVEALLKAEGYDLKDEQIIEFLRAFSALNPQLKTLSMLPKGTTVRLPLKYIVRREGTRKFNITASGKETGKEIKKPLRNEAERQKALGIIQRLANALGEGIAIDKEGIKTISSGSVVAFSLDSDYFPLLYTGGKRIILDYQGILPSDIQSIIEVLWPEYRVIRTGGNEMRNLVPAVLDLFGYSSEASGKVVLGDGFQVEIYPDYTAYKKSDALAGGPFLLIMILGRDEYGVPDELKNLARLRDIRIIEMAAEQVQPGRAAHTVDMRIPDRKGFLERFLTLTGYSFKRDASLSLSDRKEYTMEIKADFLLGSGKNLKIIDLSGTIVPYEGYLRKKGIEMLSLRQQFNRTEIVMKTAQFLKMQYETDFRRTSSLIAQKNRRFKVMAPGIFISRESGRYFWPEPGIDTTLLSSLMSDSVRLIRH